MKAKKYYGQNFLKNEEIIKNITDLVNPGENDLIIEIGPGRGALTKFLIKKNCDLVCIEIDTDLKVYLDKYQSKKCKIIYEDILNVDLNEITKVYQNVFVVGNLPYYITSPILEYLINSIKAQKMVFMVQKEVGDRLSAKVGTKEYSSLSVYLNYYYDIKKEFIVKRNCFLPSPNVDSVVVSFKKKDKMLEVYDEKLFFKLVRDSFKFKRKNIRNNLKEYNLVVIEKVLKKYNFDLNVRAEAISIDIFVDIANNLVLYEKEK